MLTEAITGARRAKITLTATSGDAYACNVTLEVVGSWQLSSADLSIDDVVLGEGELEAFSRTVEFHSDQDELLDVRPRCDWLDVRMAKRKRGGAEILLRGVRDRLSPGFNVANVVVATSNSVKPEGTIYVKVRAVPALAPTSGHITLLGSSSKRVSFLAHDGRPVQLVRAESTSAHIRVQIVAPDAIELTNVGGQALPEIATVTVTDERSRKSVVQVSTFAGKGEET
jgi:hypothetical protein